MPDGAIVIPDTSAAPKDYTLAGAQEVALKSVRAVIDGSGAGSAFLPTLQLLDANGHVCWEGATPSTVAAGGSADVSWFPSVGATSGSGTATAGATAYLWGVFGAQTIASGAAGSRVQWQHLQTNDTSVFGTDTSNAAVPPYHNTAGDTFAYFRGQGAYVAGAAATLASGVYAQSAIIFNDGSQDMLDTNVAEFSTYEALSTNTDAFGNAGGQNPSSRRMFYVETSATPGVVSFIVAQTSGANKALINVNMGIIFGNGGTGTLTQIY